MQKQYFFLSGMQRAGSTLLGSLLNQNPNIYVSPTSPLMDLYCILGEGLHRIKNTYTYNANAVDESLQKNLIHNYYSHRPESIIIDKHRGWTRNVTNIEKFIGDGKIICTYRPIAENIVSFIKLCEKDDNNLVDLSLRKEGKEITNTNRAIWIWENLTYEIYDSFRYGLKNHREKIYVCHYDSLVSQTQIEMNRIYWSLGLDKFEHDLSNVINTCSETKDEIWGFSGLHDVRPKIEKQSPNVTDYLDDDLISYFETYDKLLNQYNI